MIFVEMEENPKWWHTLLWKWSIPLNIKLFIWVNMLENKILLGTILLGKEE